MEDLSRRLANEVDLSRLGLELEQVAYQTMQPNKVSVWVRETVNESSEGSLLAWECGSSFGWNGREHVLAARNPPTHQLPSKTTRGPDLALHVDRLRTSRCASCLAPPDQSDRLDALRITFPSGSRSSSRHMAATPSLPHRNGSLG